MKISYNWLKWYVPEAPEPEKLADIFTYHLCEVESLEKKVDGDVIFDLNILPNRAHDLLSHLGIARELASLLNIKFVDPSPMYKIPESKPTKLKISITTKKDRRHVGRVVRNVKVGPSPEWVVEHLESIGQRSINNIVDATNLTMFDCGQPTHAFDLNKVEGLELNIRDAKKGDKIVLLTGEEKELDETMLVIADGAGNPLDSGIKGGKHAAITTDTPDIILEADNFDPIFARKTGQKLNIFTDARKRFENDLSPELAPYAMRELSALIAEMCPEAQFEDIIDTYPQKQEERKLTFSAARISKILGIEVTVKEIEDILMRYNFAYIPPDKGDKGGLFEITVPPMRLDLTIEEDMAEEIGRILGYDKVKPIIPKINFQPKQNETYAKINAAREKLLSEGYSEVMTYAFREKGKVEVEKSASDKKFLRTNLADGLKESLKLNQLNSPLLGLQDVKVFEIGTVWNPKEEIHVAYNEKNNIVEKNLNEVMTPPLAPPLAKGRGTGRGVFQPWSLYPFIARDIAVWMEDSNEARGKMIFETIPSFAGKLLQHVIIFDQFRKDGKYSCAFRIIFQSFDRTLTDKEVNDIMENISKKIVEQGWQVR
jgi:phenylalanyl-tRNA synthetase beta chain